jgi:hypothetical protein
MVNILLSSAQYTNAREGAIAASELLYGECSNEYIQTTNAWHAVGVGTPTTCANATVQELNNNLYIYPNPTKNTIKINYNIDGVCNLKIFNMNGQLIQSFSNITKQQTISLQDFDAGVYVVEINNGNNTVKKKVIKY